MATGTDIWDLRGCTPQQQVILTQGFDRCSFDFNLLKPGLAAGNQWSAAGKTSIPVTFRDLSGFQVAKRRAKFEGDADDDHDHAEGVHVITAPGNAQAALGLFWFDGRVEIDSSLVNQPELCQEVFFAEGAHATDMYYMNVKGWRPTVFAFYHPQGSDNHGWFEGPYFTQVGEAFMGGFIRAFTNIPLSIQGFVHPTTDEIAEKIRALLLPPVTPPPPPPPPEPVPTNIKIMRQPGNVKVGETIAMSFMVEDQNGSPMVGLTATVTPRGNNQTYIATQLRPTENGVFIYQNVPTKVHPTEESFYLQITVSTLTRQSVAFVVDPKDTAPPPPPPPPTVYITAMRTEFTNPDRGVLTVYYSDGSFKAVAF